MNFVPLLTDVGDNGNLRKNKVPGKKKVSGTIFRRVAGRRLYISPSQHRPMDQSVRKE